MRVLYLTSNENAMELYDWLSQREEVFLLKRKIYLSDVEEISPDIVVSYNYSYIISEEVIDYLKGNIINLHISLLPWNRGASPNFWIFIDNTPKGVTIHYINKELDRGEIIVQKEIFFDEETETLSSSYNRLHKEIQVLFKDNWKKIKEHKIETISQEGMLGSYHSLHDLERLKERISFSWDERIIEIKDMIKSCDLGKGVLYD